MQLVVHTDGGSRGNPGEGAVGVVIQVKTKSEKLKAEEIIKFGKRIGKVTNNEAEYQAVIEALKAVKNYDKHITSIHFFMDSLLVCEQLNGRWKIKQTHLQELLFSVRQLEQEIRVPIAYHHIPREENIEADLLVNQALDTT